MACKNRAPIRQYCLQRSTFENMAATRRPEITLKAQFKASMAQMKELLHSGTHH